MTRARYRPQVYTAILPLERDCIVLCQRSKRGNDDCAALQKALRRERPDVRVLHVSPQARPPSVVLGHPPMVNRD